ncbi:MAG: BamA/TamA family outer membrane protein [Ignavibacteriales bacterium]|nr:BamA/TamA family outer membrane protein [Ignavibacteriales bacterium]
MKLLFVSMCMMSALASSVSAQEGRTIQSLTLKGNTTFRTSEIIGWMRTKEEGVFHQADFQADLELIIAHYGAEGLISAKVDSFRIILLPDSAKMDITVAIYEGSPAVVHSLSFEGIEALRLNDLQSKMETRIGKRFIPSVLESDIKNLLHEYEKAGFPFAKIVVNDISFMEKDGESLASIVLGIREGTVARISELRVEGNVATKAYVIEREARLKTGELFRGDMVEKIRRRIEQLQLFSSVSAPELYLKDDGSAGLLLKVAEGNPNRFDGIVGYIPSNQSGGEGYVTGLIDLQFRNLLGTGRKLSTRWYREDQNSQEIQLRYFEPWVASYPVNFGGEFFQRKQDSTYVLRRYNLNADVVAFGDFTVGLSFTQTNVFPSQSVGSRFVSESRSTSIGISVFYDSRDDPVTPTDGFRYRTEYHTGYKEISNSLVSSENGRNSTQRLTFDAEYFVSPLSRQVIAVSLFGREFRSATIEASDLFRLGGAGTLRGYRESQFLGSRLVWSNVEYRFIVAPRSYAFGFVDGGYISTPEKPLAGLAGAEQTKFGYGIGVRLDSALGLIGVSLALGQGDTFSTAKLHFRLINEF